MTRRPARDTKADRIQRVVLEVLAEHLATGGLPTTNRFVFYELGQRGQAKKAPPDDHRPNRRRSIGWPPGSQDVLDAITRLRDDGIIPWDWFVDEERHLATWNTASTIADYLRDRIDEATLDPWDGDPPMLLCESKRTRRRS
jgi:hypothetical protein